MMTGHTADAGEVPPAHRSADDDVVKVLGLVGSLRAASYNQMLLDNALDLAPSRMEISVFEDLAEIPPYNADVAELGDPPSVASLKDAIGLHDALLVASPEYTSGFREYSRTRSTGLRHLPASRSLEDALRHCSVPPPGCSTPLAVSCTFGSCSSSPGRTRCYSQRSSSPEQLAGSMTAVA